MGKTLTEKLIESHLVTGEMKAGSEIAIRIDQTLTQDATGTMAYLQFEALEIPRVKTELSVSYIDHNTVQTGFENADDHKYLEGVAQKYGLYLSRAGNGICHQVHLERFGIPGKTLLGADSHTPTGGGLGMLAIGAGGLDVALAMAGEPFFITAPKVIGINLTGRLKPWVSAKDAVLKVLEIFTTKGNVGSIFEYKGPGLSYLTVPERATIANMGAECGVTTSVFPSDDVTRQFLSSQGREKDWMKLEADPEACYEREITIDLSELEPLAAAPHSPENVVPVRSIEGIPVDQVCTGSCTNSSYKDLATVAVMLRGKTIRRETSLVVTPGSRQVLENLARDGFLADLIAAGARIDECACGFCIGNSRSPSSGAVSLRTSNRNFQGRSGTADALVYLVSPETAAAAAIKGYITDPRNLAIDYPRIEIPERFHINDGMIIPPDAQDSGSETIQRGPNIGAPPASDVFPDTILGEVTIKVGDRITTDHIMPAGARMKYRSNIARYSEFVFEPVDRNFSSRAAAIKKAGRHNIVVAGVSYGQGSSREHAAMCPMFLGVKAVLAISFERIHEANLVNFGILPLTFADPRSYNEIEQGDVIEIPEIDKNIYLSDHISVINKTRGLSFEAAFSLSKRQKTILMAGGALNLAKKKASSRANPDG
ncbi:MAG: aconitate hydratase [Syntrophales bacterium]|jgi:aconitate hydratase|nr:aconitate hydratase [Syntrophales bacterium]MDY0044742.1 aconitate hydratase [Syntrophales bacterium]